MLVMRWGSSRRRSAAASRRSSSLDMRDSLLQQPPRPEKKCPSWNCLKCTSSADMPSERVYLPLWELSSTPREKRRMGYDVIRPATTQKTASAREFLPAGVATSTPLRPKSFAAPTDSETWLDPPVGQTPHHTAFAMDVMKHGRRRSKDNGGNGSRQTQLRSPMVQRPSAAKVTLQGWLYKQGSEGLMLWKRRWFVLSEYCLFYYKGPEEEKLLGSILLPSYKISPCAPDDRVFRKFSFKAEHHNMRTYFFAADSREQMVRWMNAMSLASILQTAPVPSWEEPASSSRPSVSSVSQSADDSDSGFHGYRSPRAATTPRQGGDGASAKDTVETNGWGPQPLYANAPPKPKRLPQGDSPEPSPERPAHPQQQQTPRGGIYGVSPRQHPENRTPDPYGRPIDYEDVYGRKGAWPPPPPQAYMNEPPAKLDNFRTSPQENNNYSKPPPDVTKTYVKPTGPLRNQEAPTKQPPPATLPKQLFRMGSPAPTPAVKPRPKPPAGHPPRPHSADFLEVDVRETPPSAVQRRERNGPQGERPKSSIDVHNDDYWSEESYARKMRQSLYMHAQTQSGRATPLQKHIIDNRAKPPSHSRSPAQSEGQPAEEQPSSIRRHKEQVDRHSNQFMRSASARLPRHKSRAEAHEQADAPGSEKKIQQREESMQRLLEWKQRMLQSPLTRKSSPRPHDNSMPHSPLSHLLLRTPDAPATPGSDAGSVTFRPRRQPTRGPNSSSSSRSRSQDPGRRSAPPIHRRNSYSSDDEDIQREARSNRRPRKSATASSQQAGRASDQVDTERRRVHNPSSGSAVVLPSSPDYVNINAFGEKKQHRIPPDMPYSHDSHGFRKSGDTLTRYGPRQPSPKPEPPPAVPLHMHPAIGKTTPTIQRLAPSEDRNGKHSDSGYDSLRMQSAAAEIKRTSPPKTGVLSQPTDESQLIKEFSYQYIHSNVQDLPSPPSTKSSPEERSASRVKFQTQEMPSRYETSEQLNKFSSPDANDDEDMSSLIKARQINLRSFALGEPSSEESTPRKPLPAKKNAQSGGNNKSVRDLLADFERKSAALAKEQENINAKEARRCVFSDTETLLYDTSSDAEINYVHESKLRKNATDMKQQRRCVSRAGERSDDDDEEIAAALGIKESFISSGRELHAKRKELQNKKRKQPAKKLQVEDLHPSGYIRLSLAESMVAHEDSASSRSSPSPNPRVPDRIKSPEIALALAAAEDHYLPMTPSKKSILEPVNTPAMQLEECSYVEMGDGGSVQTLTNVFEQSTDKRMFEIQQSSANDEESHYEFLYKASTNYEPVYMEVSSIDPLKPLSLSLPKMDSLPIEHSKTSSTSSSSRTVVYNESASDSLRALPDILNSTSSQKDKSDSDDADDEASKDLETLDTPHHPRFSLSDTFRPASYYLGVGGRGNDPQDSSDSDLVSPPPIPATLPPLDDDDEDFSLDLSRQEVRKWSDEASFRLRSAPSRTSMDGGEADRLKRRPVSEELLDSFEESSFLTDYTKYGISESAYHKEIIAQEENMYATNKPVPKDVKSDLLFRERFPPPVQQASASAAEPENQTPPRGQGEASPGKNEAIGGAPYYYSDLLKAMDEETNSMYDRFQQHAMNQLRTSSRLNNQRSDGVDGKRLSDIGRHVNPIPLMLNGLLDLNDPNLIAEEIRNTTAGLVSKSVPVDERNIYESDTLRKMAQKRHLQRRRSKTPDPDIATRNLYPVGLRDKSESSFEARRRSRSLEGLVDAEESTQPPPEAQNEGADPWEEDTLWRESLRRVSRVRHTRSLDDLDESDPPATPAPAPSGRRSVDHLAAGGSQTRSAKVTRDVTYVNDAAVRPRMIRSKELYENDYREGSRRSSSRQNQTPDEDSGVYERLLPTESMERNRRGQTFVDRYEFDVDSEMFRQPTQNGSQQPHFLEESLPPSFEIDREKLRQWDLLSSAPLEDGAKPPSPAPARVRPAEEDPAEPSSGPQNPQSTRQGGGRQPTALTKQPIFKSKVQSNQQSLGGSGSGSIQESIPAVRSHQRQQQRPMTVQPTAFTNLEDPVSASHAAFRAGARLCSRGASPKVPSAASSPLPQGLLGPDEGVTISDTEQARRSLVKAGMSPLSRKMTAGALLGRTHEELVLLLIQLRRESSSLSRVAELCQAEILSQARLAELDAARKAEHLRRLEDLKRHLQEIEKQHEKGKPLVTLVDNMVKLGSMYRGSSISSLPRSAAITPPPMQRFDFNMYEQRIMEWNRLSPPEHAELQMKMQQLYHLERQLQEQALILQNLQQDKTLLQRAMGGLRHKLATCTVAEGELYHQQKRLMETEFNRVRHLLAMHSKKMEDIVVENARVEHDIMMLRQKAENQRMMSRSATPTMMVQGSTAVDLELELRRVQNLVGDLQRQRHDLSLQVRQLTEKRHSLTQTPELRGKMHPASSPAHSPASLPSTPRTRRPSSTWLETDLDSMHSIDRAVASPMSPLYVNTEILDYSMNGKEPLTPDDLSPPPPPAPEDPSLYNGSATTYYEPQDISEADDRMKRFYGIIPKTEKAEIKTVRIVKRESERRNRVKQRPSMEMDLSMGRVSEEDHPPPPTALELSLLMELQAQQEQQQQQPVDPHVFQRSLSLPRGFGKQPPPPPSRALSPRSDIVTLRAHRTLSPQGERPLSAHAQLFGGAAEESPRLLDEGVFEGSSSSGPVSPVYQSEAARAIVQEMTRRRTVPKTKRRHHTVTGGQQSKADSNMGSGARARDDLDMERALRRRVAGAPDVVRSTLSQRELKYNETTIDSILGTPNKIVIPERYVPEKEPEMSAEEQLQRLRKAESIRKMLSETTPLTSESQAQSPTNEGSGEEVNSTMKLKLAAEKKQREHILQLNQLLAQQVKEKSKMVAGSSQGNGRM
ncbi:uncharacterized protein kmr isoform X3 [Cloeon dipterum]|uniref:uncharacterized protein kmr isoform X3 n=1 Tax=Cloeon dipterum TaxID=197152 RepID=UPI00321FAFA5